MTDGFGQEAYYLWLNQNHILENCNSFSNAFFGLKPSVTY